MLHFALIGFKTSTSLSTNLQMTYHKPLWSENVLIEAKNNFNNIHIEEYISRCNALTFFCVCFKQIVQLYSKKEKKKNFQQNDKEPWENSRDFDLSISIATDGDFLWSTPWNDPPIHNITYMKRAFRIYYASNFVCFQGVCQSVASGNIAVLTCGISTGQYSLIVHTKINREAQRYKQKLHYFNWTLGTRERWINILWAKMMKK